MAEKPGASIMDEDAVKLLATVGATKLMLGRLYSLVYSVAKMTPSDVEAAHKLLIENLPKQTLVRTDDAALSDHLSAEIEAEIRQMLKGIERDLGMVPKG
jgi:hypothetical protein